jgi:hypothetical protein
MTSPFSIDRIEENLSNEDYHAYGSEVLSSSYLKSVFSHSVAKANIPLEPTEALRFGSAFHTMMEIGENGFYESHPVAPIESSNKRTKAWKEFIDENPNGITMDDYNVIHKMYLNAKSNDFFKQIRDNYEGRNEWSFFATHSNGLRFRIRPDVHFVDINQSNDSLRDTVCVFDYKSCQDVMEFGKSVNYFCYDLSAILYCNVLGIDPCNFYWLAVEKKEPYTAQVFGLSDSTIQRGYHRLNSSIQKIEHGITGTGLEIVERV